MTFYVGQHVTWDYDGYRRMATQAAWSRDHWHNSIEHYRRVFSFGDLMVVCATRSLSDDNAIHHQLLKVTNNAGEMVDAEFSGAWFKPHSTGDFVLDEITA